MQALDQNMCKVLVQCLSKTNLPDFITSFLRGILEIDSIKKTELLIYRENNTLDVLAFGEKKDGQGIGVELKEIDHFFKDHAAKYTRKERSDIPLFPCFYIPLYNDDNVLGFLKVYCKKYDTFDKDFSYNFKLMQEIISLKMQIALQQIGKSRLEDEYMYIYNQSRFINNQMTILSKELYAITSIATYISPSMNLKSFIHKTLMKLNSIFKSNVIILFLHDETKEFFNRVDFYPDIEEEKQKSLREILKNYFFSEMNDFQKPTIIKDLSFWQRYCPELDTDTYKTVMCTPLQSDKLRLGAIFLLHEEDIEYDQNSIRFLSGISNIIGLAVENKILYHHAQQKVHQEDFIIQSITKFHEQQNLKETLKSVSTKATEFFGIDTHSFLLSNSEIPLVFSSYREIDDTVRVCSRAYKKIQSEELKTIAEHIFNLKDSIIIPDLRDKSMSGTVFDYFRKKGMNSMLSVPIWDKNEHFGDLLVVTGNPNKSFSLSDLTMMQAMTDGASIAIHNSRYFNKTEYNAKFLERMIQDKNIQLKKIYESQHVRIDSRKDMIFWIDSNKEFVFVNRTMEEITGYSRDELYSLNMKADTFLSSKHQKLLQKTFELISSGRKSIVSDLEIVHIDRMGEERIVILTLTPLRDIEDRFIGIEGVGREITEKRRMEKEIEKNKSLALLGECSGAIAHQMRTPLSNLLLASKRLQQDLRSKNVFQQDNQDGRDNCRDESPNGDLSELTEIFDEVTNEIHHMDKIVTELLEYTRTLSLRPSPQDINILIKELLDSFKSEFNQYDIQIKTCFDEKLPLLDIDTILLSQALDNVIHNAVEAMPDGGNLTIITALSQIRNGFAIVSIMDTGPGIERSEFEKIFNPFYTTKDQGTGLGLSLSHRIVEAHHGLIWATNNIPQGLRVNILLPQP